MEITVFTRGRRGAPRTEVAQGLSIVRAPFADSGRWAASASYLATGLPFLTARGRAFDVYHCVQSYSPATLGSLAARIRGGRVVVKVTASNQLGEAKELRRLPLFRLRMKILERVDTFVALTTEIRDELLDLGVSASRICQIPNGVEIPAREADLAVAPLRIRWRLRPEAPVVTYTGRLSSEKGLEILLSAWSRVAQHPTHPQLLLVGPGSHVRNVESQLHRMVGEHRLEDSVRFVGEVADVSPYLSLADVFVLPSRSEGLSNALLEALAHGKPVVVTDIPGNGIITHDCEGLKVPVDDAEALADALLSLIADPNLRARLGGAARATAINRFSIESVARQYVAVFQRK
jgi:glycosyltransferase involved in cell wall biosynthesis